SIENGVSWVRDAQKALARLSPDLVEQFHEHVWVTPFTDDHVPDLLAHVPVERVLFGSDYPHAEGFAEPKQFFSLLEGMSSHDQRQIMRDNARELMAR
ncbi:MAG: amidohydrolase family protein, partial [Acidimicrobiia bacterium]